MSGALQGTFVGATGGSQTKCENVTFSPPTGTTDPGQIVVTTATTGAHIFYTRAADTGVNPTHTGDNPTGSTIRIGTNGASISPGFFGFNHTSVVRAVAYKSGLLDSDITQAIYDWTPPEPPEGGGG